MDFNKTPKGWNEISIGQYIDFHNARNSTLDSIEKTISIISILTNTTYDEVALIELTELNKISKALQWVFDTELPSELINEFELNGVKYFIQLDAKKLNASQYTAVMTHIKNSKDILEISHKALSSISMPKGTELKQLEPTYYAETSELFRKELPISIAYPLCVFFCEVSKILTNNITDYLQKMLKESKEKELEVVADLVKNGGGLQLLTTWLTETERSGITI